MPDILARFLEANKASPKAEETLADVSLESEELFDADPVASEPLELKQAPPDEASTAVESLSPQKPNFEAFLKQYRPKADEARRQDVHDLRLAYKAGKLDISDDYYKSLVDIGEEDHTPGETLVNTGLGILDAVSEPAYGAPGLGIVPKVAKTAWSGIKVAGKALLDVGQAAFGTDREKSRQVAADIAVAAPASFADLGSLGVNLGMGLGNLADQGEIDSAENRKYRIFLADKLEHEKNKLILGASEALGADPESPTFEATRFAASAPVPLAGMKATSKLMAGVADAVIENAPGAIVKAGRFGKGAAPAVGGAATYAMGGDPMVAAGIVGSGYGIPFVKGKIGAWWDAFKQARGLAGDVTPEAQSKFSQLIEAMDKAPNQTPVFQYIKDSVDQELINAQAFEAKLRAKYTDKLEFVDDASVATKRLKGPDLEVRNVIEEVAALQARSESLAWKAKANKVLTYFGKLGVEAAGEVGVGGAVMSGIAASGALPEDAREASKEGFATGAALAVPFAPFVSARHAKELKAARGKSALLKEGREALGEDHPRYSQHNENMAAQPEGVQDYINVLSGLSKKNENKPAVVLTPDQLKEQAIAEGVNVAKAPNGFEGENAWYLNSEELASGNIPHEFFHGSRIDSNPSVVSAIGGMKQAMPERVQAGLDNYNKSLEATAPGAKKLTLDSSDQEIAAAIGVGILRDLPPESLYGGKSGGDIVKQWFEKKFGSKKTGTTAQYGFPVTPEVRDAIRDALYEAGENAAQERRPPGVTKEFAQTEVETSPEVDTLMSFGAKSPDAAELALTQARKAAHAANIEDPKEIEFYARGIIVNGEGKFRNIPAKAPVSIEAKIEPKPKAVAPKEETPLKKIPDKTLADIHLGIEKGEITKPEDLQRFDLRGFQFMPSSEKELRWDAMTPRERFDVLAPFYPFEAVSGSPALRRIAKSSTSEMQPGEWARVSGHLSEVSLVDPFSDKPNANAQNSVEQAWRRAADKHGAAYANDICPDGNPGRKLMPSPARPQTVIDRPASKIADLIFPGTPRQAKVAAKKYGLDAIEIKSTHQAGFVSDRGEWLTPEEARTLGEETQQLPTSTKDSLTPEDLARERRFMPSDEKRLEDINLDPLLSQSGYASARPNLPGVSRQREGQQNAEKQPKTIEVGEEPWSIRLKELQDREWQGKEKLTSQEETELLDLHKQARKEYGSYANWFEKMGGEKDYLGGVFGEAAQKQIQFMPSEHIEREASRLGLDYNGDMENLHLFNDPITKSTITVKKDAERGELQKKLAATREKFRGDSISMMPSPNKMGFYSKLEQVVDEKMGGRASVEQIRGLLKSGGVKTDELKWTGTDDWLASQKGPVNKQDLLNYIRENSVDIQEVVKGGEPDVVNPERARLKAELDGAVKEYHRLADMSERKQPDHAEEMTKAERKMRSIWLEVEAIDRSARASVSTKFSQYVLPGGDKGSYREVLFTKPTGAEPMIYPEPLKELPEDYSVTRDMTRPAGSDYAVIPPGQIHGRPWSGYHDSPTSARSNALIKLNQERNVKAADEWRQRNEGSQFKGGHYDEPNVLAHARYDTRTDTSGHKLLYVDEFQSDLHAKGQREGYRQSSPPAAGLAETELGKRVTQAFAYAGTQFTASNWGSGYSPIEVAGKLRDDGKITTSQYDDILQYGDTIFGATKNENAVPDAPFKKTWPELAFKRLLRLAIEQGKDALAWSTGDIQIARYDLSKHFDSVEVRKNEGSDKVTVYASKDNRNVITKQTSLDKLDEVIGKDLADRARKDLETENSPIYSGLDLKVGGEGKRRLYDQQMVNIANDIGKKFDVRVGEIELPRVLEGGTHNLLSEKTKVHSLEITPAMRESVMTRGFPLFQPSGGANLATPKQSLSNITLAPKAYETKLSESEEEKFQKWKLKYAPNDSGADYDLRGAFKAGVTPGKNGHWPDTFKKPNHPTFSVESKYAKDRPDLAGKWRGEKFMPPKKKRLKSLADLPSLE